MELRLYFQMLKRGWWIITLTALTALVAALAISYFMSPQYQAVARFIVTPSTNLSSRSEVVNSLDTLDRQSIMLTYVEVMNSNRIYTDALATLQLTPEGMKKYKYTAKVLPNSSVMELTVTGPDAQMVARFANTLGDQTITFTRRLNQIYNVDFLDIAIAPKIPYRPQPATYAGVAVVLGILTGAILAILSEQLRMPLEALRERLHLDNLTNVYNIAYFSRLTENELSRNPDDILSIGIVELNGLRDIMETLPLAGLQKILLGVTETLRKELRGNDIVGRWNEISFIIMLPNTPANPASRIFERILQALSQPVKLDQLNLEVDLDAHIGGAQYSNNISTQELFEMANNSLEQARRDNVKRVYVRKLNNPFWAQSDTE